MYTKQKLDQYYLLTTEEFELFLSKCTEKIYQKKALVHEQGFTCKGIYWIQQGSIRMYELKDGKEFHQDFFFENQFATDISSLTAQVPSNSNLVALEDTVALYCSRLDLLNLYEVSHNFQGFGRQILESLLVERTQYAHLHSSLNAQERYDFIVKEKPHLLQRVPLQYLASYLGIARETLSRIRKKATK